MDRQASSECSLLASWVDRRGANAPAGQVGRSGRLGKLNRLGRAGRSGKLGKPRRSVKTGKSGRLGKQGTKQAKETEHSWHELCRAEGSEAPRSGSRDGLLHLCEASQASDGKGKLQNANFLLRCVKRCFVQTPLARFPFLLIQVLTFVVKHNENHTFLHH